MARLFVALPVPAAIEAELAPLCAGVPGARWTAAGQFHLTLRFLDEVPPPLQADLCAWLGQLAAEPFAMQLAGADFFGDRRKATALWCRGDAEPADALSILQGRVEAAADRAGLGRETRKFTPHVTLCRLRQAPRDRVGDWLAIHGLFRSAAWTVDRFTLYSSQLRPEGSLYRVEAEFPLNLAA